MRAAPTLSPSARAARRWGGLAGLALAMAVLAGCGEALAPGAERSDPREHEITADMIEAIKAVSRERHPDGTMKRFNQAKGLGCFDARFEVAEDLPESLRQGLFANPANYPARLRFANASESDDREKDFRGLSIKVSDTGADTLWGAPGVHDFLLNSHPALLAGTPQEFLDFIEATRDGALWTFFVKPWNWDSLLVVLRGRERIDSPFAIRYWSTTPFRHGDDESRAVKYSTRPCADAPVPPAAALEPGPDQLREAMRRQLDAGPVCLEFMVQVQGDPQAMPIEDASEVWDEDDSPFQPVARIHIEPQPFDTPQAMAACERISFNPWRAPAAHRPLGGINRVRKAVYSELAEFRAAANVER